MGAGPVFRVQYAAGGATLVSGLGNSVDGEQCDIAAVGDDGRAHTIEP